MSNLKVNRDNNCIYDMWNTTHIIADYKSKPATRVIQEIMHDLAPKHDLKKQTDLHEIIRNDNDYDDWEYGTEPNYGKTW